MGIYHLVNLMALSLVFVIVFIIPVVLWCTSPMYRRKLHRAYIAQSMEWHPLLPLPAQVYQCPSYQVVRGVPSVQKKFATRKKAILPRKSGRK